MVKRLKHADMESKGCIHRATAGARGRAAPVRNGCYRLSALLWKQASGGGCTLKMLRSPQLSYGVLELVASKWLPVAREWSLWWLLLHLPGEQMSRPPWSLGGIRQELPCGDPEVLLRNVLLWLFDLRATHKMPTSSQWLASQEAKMTSCYWQICFSDLIMRPTLHTSVSTGLWSHCAVDPLSF